MWVGAGSREERERGGRREREEGRVEGRVENLCMEYIMTIEI